MKASLQAIARKFGYRLANPIKKIEFGAPLDSVWDCFTRDEGKRLYQYEQILATKTVTGDIVECGVAGGDSLIFLMKAIGLQGVTRSFWGFDTFEGFPQIDSEDGSYLLKNTLKQAEYRKYTIENVEGRLSSAGIRQQDFGNGQLVKGIIPASFSSYSGAKVALLNVDLDLYAPILATLGYFWPLMSKGGVIMLDEYDLPEQLVRWPGAKIAIDEFCLKNEVALQRHFTNRVFLVKN